LLNIGGHLAGEGEEDVCVLIQRLCQSLDCCFGGWGDNAPLDLAQVGWFDPDLEGYAPQGELGAVGSKGQSFLADECPERQAH
jgi:hypothetical protein